MKHIKEMKPKTIALLVMGIMVVIILLRNMTSVELNILFWSVWIPKLVLILVSVFLGWIVGWFSHIAHQKGKQKKAVASAISKEVKEEVKRQVKGESGQAETPTD